jgi:hypothetical protein
MKNKKYLPSIFFLTIFLACYFLPKDTFSKAANPAQKSDTLVVSNPKNPIYKNGLKMRIVFEEDLTIGEIEGDDHYMFGSNIVFNTDENGNFYVSDFDNHRIQKYDPGGRYLLTIGREGQGPGEFQTLSVVRFDKDNNLYVTDGSNRRISFFNRRGEFLHQISLQERYENLYINSKDFFVANRWKLIQEGGVSRQTSLYGLFDSKFNLMAELFKDEFKSSMPSGFDESSLVNFLANLLSMTVFRPQVRYTVSSKDLIYLGYPEKYEIHIYSPEGISVKKITRDFDPIPVKEKDKKNFLDIAINGFSAQIFTDEIKKKAFPKIKYPKNKPAYNSFVLMENGWLAVIVESVKDEYTLFDVFDQEGKYIANFKTPIPAEGILSEFFFFKNDHAYAVVTEKDYKFVKRYTFEIQEYKV